MHHQLKYQPKPNILNPTPLNPTNYVSNEKQGFHLSGEEHLAAGVDLITPAAFPQRPNRGTYPGPPPPSFSIPHQGNSILKNKMSEEGPPRKERWPKGGGGFGPVKGNKKLGIPDLTSKGESAGWKAGG